MPLESGWTRLPSSWVERTKAAFPICHPRACCHLRVPAESPAQSQLSSGAAAGARTTQPRTQHSCKAAAIPAGAMGGLLRVLWRGLEHVSVAPSQKHLVSKQQSPTSHQTALNRTMGGSAPAGEPEITVKEPNRKTPLTRQHRTEVV